MNREEAVSELIKAGKWIMEHRMTWGSSGNLSLKLDDGQVLITASGTRLGSLHADDFAICAPDGSWSGRKPSKELSCHLAVYRSVPWARAVIHVSPYYTTLAASTDLHLPNDLFIENMYYLQRITYVPYAHPGSTDLAESISKAAVENNVILMRNHGVMLYDEKLSEALCGIEVLENTCRMAVDAAHSGLRFQTVPPEQYQDFLLRSGYRPPRPWNL